MHRIFHDYFWNRGLPHGLTPVEGDGYKIVMDPYRKRVSIERYTNGKLESIVYDSALVDFRTLRPELQLSWRREVSGSETLLRDGEDRVVIREEYHFKGELCSSCDIASSHGVPVAVQRMYYKSLGDIFNGVVLYDTNGHPVMAKRYVSDSSEEYLNVAEELVDMRHFQLV